jgi:hypothetical protein
MPHTQRLIKRQVRDPVSMWGSICLGNGERVDAHVANLSPEGCQVETVVVLSVGDRLRLRVELLDLAATVRWSLWGTAGLKFDDGDWT